MARPRKAAKDKELDSTLVKALAFVKPAQSDGVADLALKSHCRLANGYAVAFDGVLAIGHPIEEELNLCPHSFRLLDALSRCKSTLSITQLEDDKLVIKSGRFRAVVPCLNPAAIPYAAPDRQAGEVDNRIRDGFAALSPIVAGSGATVVESSLLLRNNSMVATDRQIMIEYWHGINLPNGLAIPKVALSAITKVSEKLVGIGVSDRTVTFHYENGAWLRTQLYAEAWPNVDGVLDGGDPYRAGNVPPAIFDAVEAVSPFSPDGAVHTFDGVISSHSTEGAGATYELDGVTPGLCLGAKHILAMKKHATTVDLVGHNGVSYFYGDNVRGAVTQRRS